jgi:4-amino-4-deoxy-L-arabinose transferase-like glycosyltransferase
VPRSRRTHLWLVAIVLIGLGLRLTYLFAVTSDPGFTWIDPDNYMEGALELAGEGEDWQWSFDAVRHSVEGRHYALPPLYVVFLSIFARFFSFPLSAQIAQVLLATAAIFFMFELGRLIHSPRSGLIAAAVYALWLPNIIAVWSTMQETLYVPLILLAFVLLGRALELEATSLMYGLAGAVFGLAALTRSMPVYFMLPLTLLILIVVNKRSRSWRGVAALLVGFGLMTVPYSIALSVHLGEPTFIENHGGLQIIAQYGGSAGARPEGLVGTATVLVRAFVDAPGKMASDWTTVARSVFHVNGGRLLQIYLAAKTHAGAAIWKGLVHLGADLPLVVSVILAPFGLVLARNRRMSAMFALWIFLVLGLTTLSGFGGARLRAPFEPHLFVLAAVVLAGHYSRPSRAWWVGCGALSVVAAVAVVPQLPRSLGARADYGVQWSRLSRPKSSMMIGEAGFNLLPSRGEVWWELSRAEAGRRGTTHVVVHINGKRMEETTVRGPLRKHLEYEWPHGGIAYVELTATEPVSGEPAKLRIKLPRPRRRAP